MDQVTTVRKQLKREHWKVLIDECRSSGMTVAAWCKANGVNVYAYLQYLLINMADGDWHTHPGVLDMLMPWSEEVQSQYKQ